MKLSIFAAQILGTQDLSPVPTVPVPLTLKTMWFQRRYLRCLMQIPAQTDAGICAGRCRYLRFWGLFHTVSSRSFAGLCLEV